MGTWSYPLFATVTPGKPEDYRINLNKFSKETIRHWRHCAFLNEEYNSETKMWSTPTSYNLSEFMNTGCDTHKLLDHMDNKTIELWLELFKHLWDENPILEAVQFHFFCSDTNEPYYFSQTRQEYNTRNSEKIPQLMHLWIGQSESINYFVKNKNWFRDTDERIFEFNKEMYIKNWKVSNFRHLYLQTDQY